MILSRMASLLFVAICLGLAWAIRGHFGHEWGASWAGAIGATAVLVAAKRDDWTLRWPVLVALGGIGWAVGGMMSYGIVVGYCRGDDFVNVYYGFTMLAVIGGLYGFLGGGMLGLGLESTESNYPQWASLLTEMVAGAILFWSVLIYQFEWKMTPPRSELWAACLGASAAMFWFFYRNGYTRSLRVAGYSALGAGFGFAFGNFLQSMGNLTGLSWNWWNLMEFTLGACGGLGMAFAVFSQQWPKSVRASKSANWVAFLFLLVAIPATNVIQTFEISKLKERAEQLGHPLPSHFASMEIYLAWSVLIIFFLLCAAMWYRYQGKPRQVGNLLLPFLIGYGSLYILEYHFMQGGFIQGDGFRLPPLLYWFGIATIAILGVILHTGASPLPPASEQAATSEQTLPSVDRQ